MRIVLLVTFYVSVAHGDPFPDWLVTRLTWPAQVTKETSPVPALVLSNGLLTRKFTYSPGFATTEYFSHEKNASLLRAINPEVRF